MTPSTNDVFKRSSETSTSLTHVQIFDITFVSVNSDTPDWPPVSTINQVMQSEHMNLNAAKASVRNPEILQEFEEYVSLEDHHDIIPISEDSDTIPECSLNQTFYDGIAAAVRKCIKGCTPRIPIVTGFFGHIPGSLLQQVVRPIISSVNSKGSEDL
ncbi:hypothetical protein F4604DRAFT_1683648 [Suillus subluteus]|nr:hypothetical protein F4604DRAFT_1683648 [Suillus subluteus]